MNNKSFPLLSTICGYAVENACFSITYIASPSQKFLARAETNYKALFSISVMLGPKRLGSKTLWMRMKPIPAATSHRATEVRT